jgi:hypothetical protein
MVEEKNCALDRLFFKADGTFMMLSSSSFVDEDLGTIKTYCKESRTSSGGSCGHNRY